MFSKMLSNTCCGDHLVDGKPIAPASISSSFKVCHGITEESPMCVTAWRALSTMMSSSRLDQQKDKELFYVFLCYSTCYNSIILSCSHPLFHPIPSCSILFQPFPWFHHLFMKISTSFASLRPKTMETPLASKNLTWWLGLCRMLQKLIEV